MKLNIQRHILLKSLQTVMGAIKGSSTLEILSNVLIIAKAGKLSFTATDLDVRIQTTIETEIESEGAITVPAKKLMDIVRLLTEHEVILETENTKLHVKCGTADFTLLGLEAVDYPETIKHEVISQFDIEQHVLYKMLNSVTCAVDTDSVRKALTGVCLHVDSDKVYTVGTDGKRIAYVEKYIDSLTTVEATVILPIRTVNEILKILNQSNEITANAQLSISENDIIISANNTIISSRIISEVYPDFQKIIPKSFITEIGLNREAFNSFIKRVSLVVTERNFSVTLRLYDGKIVFDAESTEIGQASDVLEVEGLPKDFKLTVNINPTFLSEPLQKIKSDLITLKVNDAISPLALSNDDDFLYVFMPLRNKY